MEDLEGFIGLALFFVFVWWLASCAAAPPGMNFANPNCVFNCTVEAVDAENAAALTTLTTTQGATQTGGTRTRTRTDTEVVP